MLGKVMKHEMKATWKVLFPLAMVLVGVTLIGMLMMNMQVFETDMGALVGLAMLLLYIIGLIALSVTAFISAGSVLPQHVWCRRLFVTYPSGNHFFLD